MRARRVTLLYCGQCNATRRHYLQENGKYQCLRCGLEAELQTSAKGRK